MFGGNGPDPDQPDITTWWDRLLRSGLGKALRWLAVLGLVLGRWAVGWPTHAAGWLPVLVLGLFLLLPDADAITAGPVKVEMRRTRQEMGRLRDQVTQLHLAVTQFQNAQANSSAIGTQRIFHTDNLEVARFWSGLLSVPASTAIAEAQEVEPYNPS